jgi:NosR/NirI family nitrous oxide reductase transcriptional regulator
MVKREINHEDTALSGGGTESFDVVWDEARDHLFPWGRKLVTRSRAIQAVTMAFALAVTVAWILGILGHLHPRVVIGWWLVWSVFELAVRVRCQPWIRQGPLLRRLKRSASVGEIVVYVGVKNVLIGGLLSALMIVLGRHPGV